MIEIPLVLRFDLLPLVAVGAGGYFALGMGDATITTGALSVSSTYESLGVGKTDYGLLGTVSVALPLLPFLKVLVDVRYLYGLANMATASGSSFSMRDWQFMGGVRLAL
jgi:hypothetical protein